MIQRAWNRLNEKGLRWTLRMVPRAIYNDILRPHLPRKEVKLNGVKTAVRRFGDGLIPWQPPATSIDQYEKGLCNALRKHADIGDTVVIIGGGYGISTTVAAKQVGADGAVHTFEASKEIYPVLKDTIRRNNINDVVIPYLKTIGESGELYGRHTTEARNMGPSDLPAGDILVIDAEGAECKILPEIQPIYSVVVVESHGEMGCSSKTVRNLLSHHGYDIVNIELAEGWDPMRQRNQENDVKVLTGLNNNITDVTDAD